MIWLLVIMALFFIMEIYHDKKTSDYYHEYRNMNKLKIVLLLLIIMASAINIYLTDSVTWAIKNIGMQAIAYDTDHFMSEDSQILEGDYTITIDLSDLSSNIGKELYNDGKHSIKLESIKESGNFMVTLRSSGEYDYGGATLISIIQHDTSREGVYKMNAISQITAQYLGEKNNCEMASTSSISYDDGDKFAFYIFPSDEYAVEKTNTDDFGVVDIIFTNLYMNRWVRR